MDDLYQKLYEEIEWGEETVKVYGKTHTVKRRTSSQGDTGLSYRYSGTVKIPKPWSHTVSLIKEKVEATTGESYNFVLCNLYQDGDASIGWHSDDERHRPYSVYSIILYRSSQRLQDESEE